MPAERMVARLTAGRAMRSAAVWGGVFALYILSSSLGYATTYKTAADRAELNRTFGNNAGLNAIIGPARHIDTVAGFTAWRSLGVLSVVGAVWGLLAGTRLLRGEEDAGRWELLLAGRTTRRAAAADALAGLGAGLAVLWAIPAVVTVAAGRSPKVRFSVGESLFMAVATVAGAAMFLAVGALAAQLASTRRQAAGYSAVVLGGAYALRLVADSGTELEWMRWLSPLGWVEELRPLSHPRPLALLPIVAVIAVLAAATVHLAGTRDLGSSTLPDRSSAPARTGLLGGPLPLAVRLLRPSTVGWAVAIVLSGLMLGLIAKSAGEAITGASSYRQALARIGARGVGAQAYLGIAFLTVALLLTLVVAAHAAAARGEEADGRVDHLLVRPVARASWLLGRIGVGVAAVVLLGVLAGVSTWLGAATQDSGVGLGTLLEAGLNVVPPAVVVLGAGVLALGVRPRAVSAVTYGLLAWSFLVQIVGGLVNANHWLLDTSVFKHMAAAPAVPPDWTANLVLLAVGVAAAAIGLAGFLRRDLAGE